MASAMPEAGQYEVTEGVNVRGDRHLVMPSSVPDDSAHQLQGASSGAVEKATACDIAEQLCQLDSENGGRGDLSVIQNVKTLYNVPRGSNMSVCQFNVDTMVLPHRQDGTACLGEQLPENMLASSAAGLEGLRISNITRGPCHLNHDEDKIFPHLSPNVHFSGRKFELQQLMEGFFPERRKRANELVVQYLSGPCGVGKTLLAEQYAFQQTFEHSLHPAKDLYTAVLWVDAGLWDAQKAAEEESSSMSTSRALLQTYQLLAADLGLDIQLDADAMVNPQVVRFAVHNRLKQMKNWLLVVDNANSTEELNLLQNILPSRHNHAHVLILSRSDKLPNSLSSQVHARLSLKPLSVPGAAVMMIRCRHKDLGLSASRYSDDEVQNKVVELYGHSQEYMSLHQLVGPDALAGLPLAIEQAAMYIDHTDCSFYHYLCLLQCLHLKLFGDRNAVPADRCLMSSFLVNVYAVGDAARQLLHICAFLSPQQIAHDLFLKNLSCLPACLQDHLANGTPYAEKNTSVMTAAQGTSEKSEACRQSYHMDVLIAELKTYSLVSPVQKTSIHLVKTQPCKYDRMQPLPTTKAAFVMHPILQEILKDVLCSNSDITLWKQLVTAVTNLLFSEIASTGQALLPAYTTSHILALQGHIDNIALVDRLEEDTLTKLVRLFLAAANALRCVKSPLENCNKQQHRLLDSCRQLLCLAASQGSQYDNMYGISSQHDILREQVERLLSYEKQQQTAHERFARAIEILLTCPPMVTKLILHRLAIVSLTILQACSPMQAQNSHLIKEHMEMTMDLLGAPRLSAFALLDGEQEDIEQDESKKGDSDVQRLVDVSRFIDTVTSACFYLFLLFAGNTPDREVESRHRSEDSEPQPFIVKTAADLSTVTVARQAEQLYDKFHLKEVFHSSVNVSKLISMDDQMKHMPFIPDEGLMDGRMFNRSRKSRSLMELFECLVHDIGQFSHLLAGSLSNLTIMFAAMNQLCHGDYHSAVRSLIKVTVALEQIKVTGSQFTSFVTAGELRLFQFLQLAVWSIHSHSSFRSWRDLLDTDTLD